MSKARSYVFTYNNYDEGGIARIKDLQAKYLVFGKETSATEDEDEDQQRSTLADKI